MTAKRKETGAAYLRVGTTIYKRVQQPLSSGRIRGMQEQLGMIQNQAEL